jgi:hypothetical protein
MGMGGVIAELVEPEFLDTSSPVETVQGASPYFSKPVNMAISDPVDARHGLGRMLVGGDWVAFSSVICFTGQQRRMIVPGQTLLSSLPPGIIAWCRERSYSGIVMLSAGTTWTLASQYDFEVAIKVVRWRWPGGEVALLGEEMISEGPPPFDCWVKDHGVWRGLPNPLKIPGGGRYKALVPDSVMCEAPRGVTLNSSGVGEFSGRAWSRELTTGLWEFVNRNDTEVGVTFRDAGEAMGGLKVCWNADEWEPVGNAVEARPGSTTIEVLTPLVFDLPGSVTLRGLSASARPRVLGLGAGKFVLKNCGTESASIRFRALEGLAKPWERSGRAGTRRVLQNWMRRRGMFGAMKIPHDAVWVREQSGAILDRTWI